MTLFVNFTYRLSAVVKGSRVLHRNTFLLLLLFFLLIGRKVEGIIPKILQYDLSTLHVKHDNAGKVTLPITKAPHLDVWIQFIRTTRKRNASCITFPLHTLSQVIFTVFVFPTNTSKDKRGPTRPIISPKWESHKTWSLHVIHRLHENNPKLLPNLAIRGALPELTTQHCYWVILVSA